eukprot:scaffold76458_cov36-Phaeocystis_antarctica.AAC.1
MAPIDTAESAVADDDDLAPLANPYRPAPPSKATSHLLKPRVAGGGADLSHAAAELLSFTKAE